MTEETVFGLDVSALEADRIATRINKKFLGLERALTHNRWFDYRQLNPVAATYLFAHEYRKAFRRYFRTNIDSSRADDITALPMNLFHVPPEWEKTAKGVRKTNARRSLIAQTWRARQVADAMGMPYDVYLDRAFHWAIRYWQRGHLPRPGNLYSDRIIERVTEDWAEHQRERFYYSKLPLYTNAKYCGLIMQNDHHEHLLTQIAARGNRPALIAQFLDEELLPTDKVMDRFDAEIAAQAVILSSQKSAH